MAAVRPWVAGVAEGKNYMNAYFGDCLKVWEVIISWLLITRLQIVFCAVASKVHSPLMLENNEIFLFFDQIYEVLHKTAA